MTTGRLAHYEVKDSLRTGGTAEKAIIHVSLNAHEPLKEVDQIEDGRLWL